MDVAAIRAVAEQLRAPVSLCDDAERIDVIRALEELKSTAAAVQASTTAQFAASQRRQQRAAGLSADRVGRGVASQVALARRISPFAAQRYVGWASIVTTEMPATFAELAAGRASEWRTMLVARETAWLSRDDRATVDREIAPQLEKSGDRRVVNAVRKRAYELDPHGAMDRMRIAKSERCVSTRPAPDGMARLNILAPLEQVIAAYATLRRDAASKTATGDARSHGQLMADIALARLTGQETADDVPAEILIEMPLDTLFNGGDQPATVVGGGPIPAEHARDLICKPGNRVPRWIRRLYRSPKTGELIAMESNRRCFTPAQRKFIEVRDDGICRTPWCDAPIREADHVVKHEHGGPTAINNGQGLCQACNLAKEAPGWRATVNDRIVDLRTPTGHHYQHAPPEKPAA